MHVWKFLGVRGTGARGGAGPPAGQGASLPDRDRGEQTEGGPGNHLACTPWLSPLGWVGRGASPCLPGAATGGCCWVLEDTEREREGHPTSGAPLWFLMPEGLSEVREPQGHTRSAFSLRLFPPPCSRDLKRDVAKKLEKLEKRTQRAIAELIRKFGVRHGGVPCPLGGGARTWPLSTRPVCPPSR